METLDDTIRGDGGFGSTGINTFQQINGLNGKSNWSIDSFYLCI